MPVIQLILDGDGAWPDLENNPNVEWVKEPIKIAVLPGGMTSGRPALAIRLDLKDGKTIVAQTSLALFATAARGIRARYSQEWEDGGGI